MIMQEILNSTGKPPPLYPIFERLSDFIDDVLCDFKPLSTNRKGYTVDSEDDITEDLVDYLDDKQESLLIDNPKIDANSAFKFTNQSKQGNKKTDIGVRLGRKYSAANRPLVCWIESKLLPTPKKNDRDEREYVIVSREKKGNGKRRFSGNGGIQRFKEGKHAPNLPYSIMIGYIQDDNNADYWLSKINEWITKLAISDNGFWTNEDCLNKFDSNKCDRFLSTHKRKDETIIKLHHYWIKV